MSPMRDKRPISEDRATQPMEAGGWVSQKNTLYYETSGQLRQTNWWSNEYDCISAACHRLAHWAELRELSGQTIVSQHCVTTGYLVSLAKVLEWPNNCLHNRISGASCQTSWPALSTLGSNSLLTHFPAMNLLQGGPQGPTNHHIPQTQLNLLGMMGSDSGLVSSLCPLSRPPLQPSPWKRLLC